MEETITAFFEYLEELKKECRRYHYDDSYRTRAEPIAILLTLSEDIGRIKKLLATCNKNQEKKVHALLEEFSIIRYWLQKYLNFSLGEKQDEGR